LLREVVDRVFRTTRQVEMHLHTRCLSVLPRLGPKANFSIAASFPIANQPAGAKRSASASVAGRSDLAASTRPYMRRVIEDPLSPFSEGFRSIKVAVELSGSRLIGITSTVPGEGKSTISSNLAQSMAHAGKRVVLVDGDLRNPSLTRALLPDAKLGLIEVLDGEVALEKAIHTDNTSGLAFLPLVLQSQLLHTDEILSSDSFKRFVETLRKDYDYVVIDFSPIAPIVDVRATTQLIESYIYVIEWGKTPITVVQGQLSRFPELHDRLLGVVLNKADIRVLDRYETYHYGKGYYGAQHYSSRA
jgi:succinoglycan biosynthesis transport protein ExoP